MQNGRAPRCRWRIAPLGAGRIGPYGRVEKQPMPRRARVVRREVVPDARYQSKTVAMFINKLMLNGKKSTAERIMYDAFERIGEQARRNPLDLFEQAIR